MTSPFVDKLVVGWTFAGQGLLVNLALVFGLLVGFNPSDNFSMIFNKDSMALAMEFAFGMFLIGQTVDRIPWPLFQKFELETRMFTLRILGRNSPISLALVTALLISAGAGFSEELFFRGLLFPIFNQYLGIIPAYVITSSLFGLAHSPVFGANALVEALLGGIFAFLFVYSGYNLAVPIAAHTMYDFLTIIVIWYFSSRDLKRRIFEASDKLVVLSKSDEDTFKILSKSVFDMLDRDEDGSIDITELNVGIKLLGIGATPFGRSSVPAKELFDIYDCNKDGKINFDEFSAVMREGIYQWPSSRTVSAK
mmetsp:Transcript_9399/g.8399  ORF Transcript_9399/g.8399 Transcript_9399/m.8399 type:complete len:309 (-) Transcript_9399:162-1088(-)